MQMTIKTSEFLFYSVLLIHQLTLATELSLLKKKTRKERS